MCSHVPRCPAATTSECLTAHIHVPHPEQGWNLLCNGVVAFDDGGVLLPSGESVAPPRARREPTSRRMADASVVGCRVPAEMVR